jgi:hypothetical protein
LELLNCTKIYFCPHYKTHEALHVPIHAYALDTPVPPGTHLAGLLFTQVDFFLDVFKHRSTSLRQYYAFAVLTCFIFLSTAHLNVLFSHDAMLHQIRR